jgi:hypothetical protein
VEPLDTALNKLSEGKRRILQKYIHKRIACNKRENLYYPYLSSHCKLCEGIEECQNHILQCNRCDKRKELREKLLKTLTYTLKELRTNKTTTIVLTHYIKSWLEGAETPNLQDVEPEASITLQQAIEDQNKLGWNQIFCGRISNEWGTLHNHDIQSTDHGLFKPTAERWGTKVIGLMFEYVLDCWTIRNEKEYDKADEESETTTKKKLIRKLIWNKTKTRHER